MEKLLIPIIIVIVLAAFFFPKNVGGVLCGPVCPPTGLHYYEQECLGFRTRDTFADGYVDLCYGLPIGERKCYGAPYIYDEGDNLVDRELGCDYPCNDMEVKEQCQTQGNFTYRYTIVGCDSYAINGKCGW